MQLCDEQDYKALYRLQFITVLYIAKRSKRRGQKVLKSCYGKRKWDTACWGAIKSGLNLCSLNHCHICVYVFLCLCLFILVVFYTTRITFHTQDNILSVNGQECKALYPYRCIWREKKEAAFFPICSNLNTGYQSSQRMFCRHVFNISEVF